MISASSPGRGPSGSGVVAAVPSSSPSETWSAAGSTPASPSTTQTAPEAAQVARIWSRPAERDTGTATAPALSTAAQATAYAVQSVVEQGSSTRSPDRT